MSAKAAPMTKEEAMLLVNLVAGNTVIMNKATNATNNKLKEQAWQTLTSEFNSASSNVPRTSAQLRLKWENLKKAARKRSAMIRSNLNRTGGGKDYFPPDEVLEKVAALLGSTCQGFTVEFGGDATTTSTTLTSEASVNIPDDGLNLVTLSEVDGDGVTVHGVDDSQVLKEVQLVETPIPQNRNFFFNRASGTGTLAKRKHKMEEEKCKARILREKALADFLIVKKRKIELENEEKEITIAKLKMELENSKLENEKLKADLHMLH